MVPTFDQIQTAAYHRWLRRGEEHGRHRQDWLAAEQDLLFSLNYRVVARYALDDPAPVILGNTSRPHCRFCERSAPAADFGRPVPVVPAALGNTALFSAEVCDDCRDQIREELEPAFLRFARPLVSGPAHAQALVDHVPSATHVPVAAFKALIAMALLALPPKELQHVEDAIEWVANPDHELDSTALGPLECRLYVVPNETTRPWIALARRDEADAPLPYLLVSLGSGRAVFQAPLPLCVRDDDLDGVPLTVPRACPDAPPRGTTPPARIFVAAETAREAHFQFM